MLRNTVLSLSILSLAAWCALTVGCGSSSSSKTTGCTGGPYSVVGDWTLTITGGLSGPGVIGSSGSALFFQTDSVMLASGDTIVMPTISGTCSFSGTATGYTTSAGGGGSMTATLQGSVNSATSISGTITGGSTFSAMPNSPLAGSLTAFSGTMHGTMGGWIGPGNFWTFTFTPSGAGAGMTFTGVDAEPNGCAVSGTFSQEGENISSLNVFDVSITYSGSGCPAAGTTTGLGFESGSDYFGPAGGAPGTYFYAISSSGATVFEIFPAGL